MKGSLLTESTDNCGVLYSLPRAFTGICSSLQNYRVGFISPIHFVDKENEGHRGYASAMVSYPASDRAKVLGQESSSKSTASSYCGYFRVQSVSFLICSGDIWLTWALKADGFVTSGNLESQFPHQLNDDSNSTFLVRLL